LENKNSTWDSQFWVEIHKFSNHLKVEMKTFASCQNAHQMEANPNSQLLVCKIFFFWITFQIKNALFLQEKALFPPFSADFWPKSVHFLAQKCAFYRPKWPKRGPS